MSTLNNLVPVARMKRIDGLGMWFFVKKTENYVRGRCYALVDSKKKRFVGEFIPLEGVRLNDDFKGKIVILCTKNADS